MDNLDFAKYELLKEAAKAGNQVRKILSGQESFVKSHRGFSYPDEIRLLFLQACEELVAEGRLRAIVRNKDLELYEVVSGSDSITCKEHARQLLLANVERVGELYKIHSPDGEFVQVGSQAFYENEAERILFLKIVCELTRKGKLKLVWDSKELCRYVLGRPQYLDAYEGIANSGSLQHLNAFGASSHES